MAAASTVLREPVIARKIREGYSRPDAELPLDINYQKLTEWLVTRQRLPADWHKRLQAIQAKIAEVVSELPDGLLARLPGGTEAPIDYFRAVEIRDKLAEGGERTLFGGLSGPAAVWDKIVKAYEKDAVFMGEASQSLVQNVDYEVPYLRRSAAKWAQQISDGERKATEYLKSAATCAANYRTECEQLGITGGGDVLQELQKLGAQLPSLFDAQVTELQRDAQLAAAVEHYQRFVQYAHAGPDGSSSGGGGGIDGNHVEGADAPLPEVLPVLSEVRAGRTAPPILAVGGTDAGGSSSSREHAADRPAADAAAASPSIEWDMGAPSNSASAAAGAGGAADIDWDFDIGSTAAGDAAAAGPSGADGTAAAGLAPVEVNWDIELTESAVASPSKAAGGPAIDWDIDVSGTDDAAAAAAAAGTGARERGGEAAAAGAGGEADSGAGAAVACSATAARLLHDGDYRSQLQDDLCELRAFLHQRQAELKGAGAGSGGAALLQALMPSALQATDGAALSNMQGAVEGVLARLQDPHLRRLLMIVGSQRYLERLAASLQRKAGQEARMVAASKEADARKAEARAQLAGVQPRLSEVVGRVRRAKDAVQATLGAQLGGRRVNVLGEVNNVLAAGASSQ